MNTPDLEESMRKLETLVPVELMGLTNLLCLDPLKCSSQRLNMLASNAAQFIKTHGSEAPLLFTGFENKFGKYTFNKAVAQSDCYIEAIIPKNNIRGSNKASGYTVITSTVEGLLDVIDIDKVMHGAKTFGYEVPIINEHALQVGGFIPAGTEFTRSPCEDEHGNYCMGTNLNVAFSTDLGVPSDAFMISESAAKKLDSTAVETLTLSLGRDDIPLPIYGQGKCMPEVGEKVGDHCILIGIRKATASGTLPNISQEALSEPNPLQDDLMIVPAGSEVLSIEVIGNNRELDILGRDGGIYSQLNQYNEASNRYYRTVWNTFLRLQRERPRYAATDEFNSLVMHCLSLLPSEKGEKQKLMRVEHKKGIGLCHLKIRYKYTRPLSVASKLTGRDGAKGVIPKPTPDDHMPVDEYGIRADLVISSDSPLNRLNNVQLYEVDINRVSMIIMKKIANGDIPITEALSTILEFIEIVSPQYRRIIQESVIDKHLEEEYVEMCMKQGAIRVMLVPGSKYTSEEMLLRLYERFPYYPTRVTSKRVDKNGKVTASVSKCPVTIGSKYMYVLCKVPILEMSAMEFSHISHHGIPIKPMSQRIQAQSLCGKTPIKLGEDETCLLTQTVGAVGVARLHGLSNSSIASHMLQSGLLTSLNPSDYGKIPMSDEGVIRTSSTVRIADNMMMPSGIKITTIDKDK